MKEALVIFFLILGVAFIMLAAIGLLRFPDIYMRISAVTKSSTLGVSSMLLAVVVHFWQIDVTARTIATILFLFSTAPIGSQMIGRAAYFVGIAMWIKSKTDEMRGKYDPDSHNLDSIDRRDLPYKHKPKEKKNKANKKVKNNDRY